MWILNLNAHMPSKFSCSQVLTNLIGLYCCETVAFVLPGQMLWSVGALKILKEGFQMHFSNSNFRLCTRVNYVLLFNAPYIFNLSRFLKISLFGTIMLEHSILWSYTPPSHHILLLSSPSCLTSSLLAPYFFPVDCVYVYAHVAIVPVIIGAMRSWLQHPY